LKSLNPAFLFSYGKFFYWFLFVVRFDWIVRIGLTPVENLFGILPASVSKIDGIDFLAAGLNL